VGVGHAAMEDLVTRDATSGVFCRLCAAELRQTFADLGVTPLANAYLSEDDLVRGEVFYPLHAYVCGECFLVQLPAVASPDEIFLDYPYFSSYSDSWLEHARRYAAQAVERFGLDGASRVVEVASNDGYLLQYFRDRGVEVLGVEPARNVAEAAVDRGVPTVVEFFGAELGERLAAEGHAADLAVGNNVLAHVPDLHDFVEGLRALLKPDGVLTMEFPHVMRLIERSEFDTIYHEHFSYLSLVAVDRLFREHELALFDVEELATHGGSLRIFAAAADSGRESSARLHELRAREDEAGLRQLETYAAFDSAVRTAKRKLLSFLIGAREEGRTVVAYGAAAKGNTLLNYCGIRADLVDYVVDRSPHKQGRYLPGTHLPIHAPERVAETRPDYLLILPWNLADEITEQMGHVREWGCRFVIPIPRVAVLP
jgi:SAM-dependent methyltransferase